MDMHMAHVFSDNRKQRLFCLDHQDLGRHPTTMKVYYKAFYQIDITTLTVLVTQILAQDKGPRMTCVFLSGQFWYFTNTPNIYLITYLVPVLLLHFLWIKKLSQFNTLHYSKFGYGLWHFAVITDRKREQKSGSCVLIENRSN